MSIDDEREGRDPVERSDGPSEVAKLRLDRRGFLQTLGIGSGVAALAACERIPTRHALPFVNQPEDITPGVPVHYATTCGACPAACGVMVTVRDGRPIKLEGHPEHPLSRQGLCAVGQAELRALYDSERLAGPTIGGASATWAAVDEKLAVELRGPVWVLTPTLVSPSARRAVAELLAARGGGRHVQWDPDPQSASAALDAAARVYGVRALPWLDFERADVVAVFGADLFGAGYDPVAHTASWSARKKAAASRGALRHIQLEGNLTLTGAAADERWQATATERTAAAVWLAHRLAELTGADLPDLPPAPAQPPLAGRLEQLARELAGARGRSLVVSGAPDVTEQVAIAHCNRMLGNVGGSIDVARPSLVRRTDDAALAALRDALAAGEVGALIVAGVDPVQDLPDGDAFAEQLARVPLSVAIAERANATTAACTVVAAAHNAIECWGDALPRPGVLTVQQPTVRPLRDTRHPYANLAVWAGAGTADYRAFVMDTWRRFVFPRAGSFDSFDTMWTDSVRRGSAEPRWQEGASPAWFGDELAATARAATLAVPAVEPGLRVEATADAGIRDARTAQNPWLRELPDPLTRVAWTPTARIAPRRATELGVRDGDVIAISVDGRRVELAARVVPGQHTDVLGVPIGYGPRVTDGPAAVERTGARHELPLMQVHAFTEGRPIVHEVSRPDERPPEGHHAPPTPYPGREIGGPGAPSWHMVIDLDRCSGCSACVVACQAENNVAVVGPDELRAHRDMYWLRVDRYFVGEPDDPNVLFEPMMCGHCDSAPCENVCPVVATVHSIDGLNMQAYNRCVGTRYCANNCPYKVRRFNWLDYDHGGPLERMVLNPDVVVRERGVMEKCSFCVQRIQLARIEGKNAGDRGVPDVRTACQQSCPADAITFGDAADPDSAVSRARRDPRAFQVLAEIGTRPSITYLARVRSRREGK